MTDSICDSLKPEGDLDFVIGFDDPPQRWVKMIRLCYIPTRP